MDVDVVPDRTNTCMCFFCAVKTRAADVQRYLAFPLKCKSWDCPGCRREKAKNYRRRIGLMWDGRGLFFLTLTYFHSLTPDEAWQNYNVAWNRLRTYLMKRYGRFEYVRILESHNDSPYPHLHIIVDKLFPAAEFGRLAIQAGFGYQIRSKKIDSLDAREYLTKYLTKQWRNSEGWALRKAHRCRIISFSRGIMVPEVAGEKWVSLIAGTDFETCLEHIRTDVTWRTDATGYVVDEHTSAGAYEVTIVWEDRPPHDRVGRPDLWQPDDWVPR
jgi:hypothetical protein